MGFNESGQEVGRDQGSTTIMPRPFGVSPDTKLAGPLCLTDRVTRAGGEQGELGKARFSRHLE